MTKSLKQVLGQIAKLEREAAILRSKEVAGVVARIKEAIGHYGLSVEDLFGKASGKAARKRRSAQTGRPARAAKSKLAPKYRDEAGNTWGGIGKRPNWFKQALASGKSPEDLAIKD